MGIAERKKREKSERRNHIKNAANKVFLEKGLTSATMEDIANASELSLSTVYLYFKTKDGIFASIILESLQSLLEQLENIASNRKANIDEKLFLLKETFRNTFRDDPVGLSAILRVQLEEKLLVLPEKVVSQIMKLTHECLKAVASMFEEGIKEKKIINEHPMALSDVTWGLFIGITIWELSKTSLNPKKHFLDSTLDLAFRILSKGTNIDNCK